MLRLRAPRVGLSMRLSGTACDGADRSIVCAQFHSCEYGYIRSVHVNNAVNIALSHYSVFTAFVPTLVMITRTLPL